MTIPRSLSAALFLITISGGLVAQPNYPSEGCFIRYQYDDSGNRIQRDWMCISNANSDGNRSTLVDLDTTSTLRTVHMNLAPNPAAEETRVTFTEDTGVGTLQVHDSQGRQVLSRTAQGPSFMLNVAAFQSGAYYVSFIQGTERIVTGFSIQR